MVPARRAGPTPSARVPKAAKPTGPPPRRLLGQTANRRPNHPPSSNHLKETRGLQSWDELRLNLNTCPPHVSPEKRLLKALQTWTGSKGWNKAPVRNWTRVAPAYRSSSGLDSDGHPSVCPDVVRSRRGRLPETKPGTTSPQDLSVGN